MEVGHRVRRCSWTWPLGVITIKEPKVKVNRQSESVSCQLRPALCDPMDYRSHWASLSIGILQARILEGIAISSSRGPSWHRDQPTCPTLQADSLLSEPPWAYEGFKVGPPECGGCGQIGIRKMDLQVTDSPRIKWGTALPLHCLGNCFFSAWHWGSFCKWGDEWLHSTDINARIWEQK